VDSSKKKKLWRRSVVSARGSSWTISYCQNGKEIRETTTNANSKLEAKKILKQRLGAIGTGKSVMSLGKQGKYTFSEMADLLLLNHQVAGFSNAVKWPLKNLRRYFGL